MDILNDLKLQKNTKIEFAPTDDTFFDNSGSIYADSIAAGNIHIVSADNGTLGCSGIFIESGSNIELNIAGGNTNEGSFVINKGDTNNIFSITAHNSQNCVDYSGEPDTLIIKSNLKNINIESLSEFGDGEISLKNPSKISLKAPTIYISESCNDDVVIPGRINSGHGDLEIDSTSHLNEGLEVYGGHCSGEPNISATFEKGISVGQGIIERCTEPSAKFYAPIIVGNSINFENLEDGKTTYKSINGINLIAFEAGRAEISGLSNLALTEFSVRRSYSDIKINTDDTNHIAQIEFTGVCGSNDKTVNGKIFIDDKQFGLESSADLFFNIDKSNDDSVTEYVLSNGPYVGGNFNPSYSDYIKKIFNGQTCSSYTASNNKIYKEDQIIATIGYTNKLIYNIFDNTEFSIVEHFEPFVRNAAKNKTSDIKPTNSLNITKFTEFKIPSLVSTDNKATHIESLQQMFINGFVFEDNGNMSSNERYCKVVEDYGIYDGLMAPMVQVFGYDDKCRITQKQVDTFFCKTTGELEIQIGTVSDVPAGCLFAKVFI